METVRNGFAAIGAAAVASSVAIFLWHAYDRVSGADTAEDTASRNHNGDAPTLVCEPDDRVVTTLVGHASTEAEDMRCCRVIDLSHTIVSPMPSSFSAAAPHPAIVAWQSHAAARASGHYSGCSCEITQVSFLTSIGTYVDAPMHFHEGKRAIAQLDLDQLMKPAIVIDCRSVAKQGVALDPAVIDGLEFAGKAVLLWTGWGAKWGRPEYQQYPFIGAAMVAKLMEGDAKFVGVDFLTVDNPEDKTRPAHNNLLRNDVLICENMCNLGTLWRGLPATAASHAREGATFVAVPPKIHPVAAFPVRAFAML